MPKAGKSANQQVVSEHNAAIEKRTQLSGISLYGDPGGPLEAATFSQDFALKVPDKWRFGTQVISIYVVLMNRIMGH